MNDEQMTKAKLLEQIQTERRALEAVLAQVGATQMTAPLLDGGWSVKDVLAHIFCWEQHVIHWVKASLQGAPVEAPPYDLPNAELDAINARYQADNKDRSLADVRQEFNATYQEILTLTQTLTEEQLFDPERYAWRDGHPLWELIGANTFWHYLEHREAIENILAD